MSLTVKEFCKVQTQLFKDTKEFPMSRKNFAKRVKLIHKVHEYNHKNLDFIFSTMLRQTETRTIVYAKTILERVDNHLQDVSETFTKYNLKECLDEECFQTFREFCLLLLEHKEAVKAKLDLWEKCKLPLIEDVLREQQAEHSIAP